MRHGTTHKGEEAIVTSSKIATCCHCGTRAVLRMGLGHHTLTCSACGAPLSSLKSFPVAPVRPDPAISHQPAPKLRNRPKATVSKPKKPSKKRKGLLRKLAEEAFDLVEDIFD